MKAPSLHRRSVAATTATVACVLLATGLSVFLVLRAHLEGDLTDLLTERSVTVRMLADDLSGEKLVAELRDRGIRATIHTADGRALVSAPQRPQAAGRLPGSEEPPLAVMSTQIDLPDGDRATIAVARDGVDRALRRLAALEAAAVLLGALAAAVLASRAARAALRPLEDVVAAAELTTAERTDKRLDPERTDTEVGRLAGAFDAMLDRLDEALHQVRTSDERSQRFLADAAHQLRGPIASAKVAAEAVLVAPRADEPAQECHLARVAAECGRAGELVADLLVLARLDQDSLSAREPVDVTTLVWQEASRTAELAPTLSIDVHAPEPTTVRGDAVMLREALANLLDNARRHARERVHISATRDEGHVFVTVLDDGPGIPDDQIARAFERFASFDGHGGTGLGLPIARDVARAHGGQLSYAEGAFAVQLPAGGESPGNAAGGRV